MCPPKYGANLITVSEIFELPRTSNSFTGVGFLESLENAQVLSLLWVPKLSAGYPFITINTPFQMSGNYFVNNCPIRRVSSMVFYYSVISTC